MRTWMIVALAALGVSGCVLQPSPYYGGSAPYYGTAIAPAYVGVGVNNGYYPYYSSQHIRSNYNNDYWHHMHGNAGGGAGHASAPHSAVAHAGGGKGGHGGEHH